MPTRTFIRVFVRSFRRFLPRRMLSPLGAALFSSANPAPAQRRTAQNVMEEPLGCLCEQVLERIETEKK